MADRNPLRYLAPILLVGLIVGVFLIVHHNVSTHATTPSAHAHPKPVRRRRIPRIYTVRPGDIMSSIAAKTGVPLDRLESLNPSVFPNSLQTGQRLRLR
jgi:LysM repeat protein